MSNHHGSAAEWVSRTVTRSRSRFFSVDDFPELPREAAARSLSRLLSSGELTRVRRGTYWRGQKTLLGMAPPPPLSVLLHIYGVSAAIGPARLDAAGMLGLSSQVSARPTFAVPYQVEGLKMNLVNRDRRRDRNAHHLNPTEVALLEVLDGWDELVEVPMEIAVRRITTLIENGSIRPERVARGANTEPPAVRERLRSILNAKNYVTAAKIVQPARTESIRLNAIDHLRELMPG